jgi:hypothetical protein
MKLKDKGWKFKLGLVLIGLSLIFFALLIVIPLLDIERGIKIKLTTVSFILAEVLFYTGGFFLGKELFNKYKSYFNPKNWLKKKAEIKIINENTSKIGSDDLMRS